MVTFREHNEQSPSPTASKSFAPSLLPRSLSSLLQFLNENMQLFLIPGMSFLLPFTCLNACQDSGHSFNIIVYMFVYLFIFCLFDTVILSWVSQKQKAMTIHEQVIH